jgi:putative (di)nucleoside polyphosphate hydrolase
LLFGAGGASPYDLDPAAAERDARHGTNATLSLWSKAAFIDAVSRSLARPATTEPGMPPFESLPYRPCVGTAVFNRDGRVFIGRRINGPEHVDEVHAWQMPQGGIDSGEHPWPAALRELYEETNIRSVEKLGEIEEQLCYDIPRHIVGQAWKGKYRGQCQKWYALRFTGSDREIDIAHPAGGHKPEFVEWRWERLQKLPDLIIPFKRPVYARVVKEFAKFAKR